MEIILRPDRSLFLDDIDGLASELIRLIPAAADPSGDPRAEARILPPDPGGGTDTAEWRELVHPELRHLFLSAVETVREAVETLPANSAGSILIGPNQIEAWLNALNQARLVLAERNGFTDEEIASKERGTIGSRRDLALLQIDFYGFIQEHLVAALSGE